MKSVYEIKNICFNSKEFKEYCFKTTEGYIKSKIILKNVIFFRNNNSVLC